MKIDGGFRRRGNVDLVLAGSEAGAIAAANEVARLAAKYAPKKTHALADSIKAWPVREISLDVVRIEVVAGVPYAGAQERGTGIFIGGSPITITPVAAKALSWLGAAWASYQGESGRVYYRHVTIDGVPGTFYMRRAFDEVDAGRIWSQAVLGAAWEAFLGRQ